MRQSAVILARVLGFIEVADLISGGSKSVAEIVRSLSAEYSFEKVPSTVEDLDLGKGIEFAEGKAGHYPIQKLVIYDTLFVLETRIHTAVSKQVLEDMLMWGARELGMNYPSSPVKRWAYVSDVMFYSDAPLLDVNPAVSKLASRSSEELAKIWGEPIKYEPLTVSVGHDPSARKNGVAPFMITHRAQTRFSENKYFSEAPLPTDIHLSMLEEYEADMIAYQKGGSA